MNKSTIIKTINNFTFCSNNFDAKLVPDAVDIFFNIFDEIESHDWTKYNLSRGSYNINVRIAYIIRSALTSQYLKVCECPNKLIEYQRFLALIYTFTKTNMLAHETVTDVDKIYHYIDNIGKLKPNVLDKYWVGFIKKPNSQHITDSFKTMFGGGDRYRFGDDPDFNLMEILESMCKMELSEKMVFAFNDLAHDVCFGVINHQNCKQLIDGFCKEYLIILS